MTHHKRVRSSCFKVILNTFYAECNVFMAAIDIVVSRS